MLDDEFPSCQKFDGYTLLASELIYGIIRNGVTEDNVESLIGKIREECEEELDELEEKVPTREQLFQFHKKLSKLRKQCEGWHGGTIERVPKNASSSDYEFALWDLHKERPDKGEFTSTCDGTVYEVTERTIESTVTIPKGFALVKLSDILS